MVGKGCITVWAVEIMNDLKTIKQSMSKIDNIEKLINKVNQRVEQLDLKLKNVESRVDETESSCIYISSEFESSREKLTETKSELKSINEKLNNQNREMENEIQQLKTRNESLDLKVDDLEYRSLRDNLLFHGLPEQQGENCEQLISDLIHSQLNIDSDIKFERVHRIGKQDAKKGPRPIVSKFHEFKDRELVLTTAQSKYQQLKNSNIGVGIQQTKKTLSKRRELYPLMEKEQTAGNKVKWSGARLMVCTDNSGVYREKKP